MDADPGVEEAAVRAGMARMALRGPDDEGFFACAGVALGHRRLAVIDVKGGLQPMPDRASGAVIVFNGEIYNHRDLRARLMGLGHEFRTASDTEVLLKAYTQWGPDCLDKLSGMFAFAVYDPRAKSLFMARDRVGIKPLFYSVKDGKLMFASSIPAMLCFKGVKREMNLRAVSHYLTTSRLVLGDETLISGITAMPPGEFMLARQGQNSPQRRRYWDFPALPANEKSDPGLDAAAERVARLMADSVREQLISDVPLGGFLSGGIDSSIIAALALREAPGNYDAYSIGFDREGYNEWPFVRLAAGHHKMKCTETTMPEDEYPSTWRMLTAHHGLPLTTPNEPPLYRLARELKRDFTVALSGEGADEIFGGYAKSQFSAFDYERARRAPPAPGENLTALDAAMFRFYRRPYFIGLPDHFLALHCWLPFRQKPHLFQPEAWAHLEGDRAMFEFYEDFFGKISKCTPFDAYMHIHARINLEGLLFRVDACTMAASVEARVPFTDHKTAEYAFSLPDRLKIDWRNAAAMQRGRELNIAEIDAENLLESKVLLRKAFAGEVPREILDRPKMSFPVPICEWFSGSLHETAVETLGNSPLRGALFNPKMLDFYLETSGVHDSAMALWPVVNLCMWQETCGIAAP